MAHISFSELKDWVHCPFYHKLTRVDKIDGFTGNEYTAFGSAIHSVCEKKLLQEELNEDYFVNVSGLKEHLKTKGLIVGQKVSFDVDFGMKGDKAINVKVG